MRPAERPSTWLIALIAATPVVTLTMIAARMDNLAADVSESLPAYVVGFAIACAAALVIETFILWPYLTGRNRLPWFGLATILLMFPGCCLLDAPVNQVALLNPAWCYTSSGADWPTSHGDGLHLIVRSDGNVAHHRPSWGMVTWPGKEAAGLHDIDFRSPLPFDEAHVRRRIAPTSLPDAELDSLASSIWLALQQVADGHPITAPGAIVHSPSQAVQPTTRVLLMAPVWSGLLVAAYLIVGRFTLSARRAPSPR